MPKTKLPIVGRGYKAIGFSFRCPRCGSRQTTFSAHPDEMCWVCFDCGELFTRGQAGIAPAIAPRRSVDTTNTTQPAPLPTTVDFNSLRARLSKKR